MTTTNKNLLRHTDTFVRRHVGPGEEEVRRMLDALGYDSLDALIDATVPGSIRLRRPLALGPEGSEYEILADLRVMMSRNRVFRSFIGMGYHDCIVPPVIQRNVLENPGWYTQYTPYQAEIAQGRLEALLNFQTMVVDLTGLPVANASLLDEGTAAAEAMAMAYGIAGSAERNTFFVASDCHPQTVEVVRTRARARGIDVLVGDVDAFDFSTPVFGVLLQYPATDGAVIDHGAFAQRAREEGAVVVVSADLLSLALLAPPGEWGADIAVGTTQRLGVPLGFGGPHAGYFACRDEYKRQIPGRIIGVSTDAQGSPALRMALQTREQHIRREKATSNICTAQVLLAVMAGMYAVYHGPEGLRKIAERVHFFAAMLAEGARTLGYRVVHEHFFDTVRIDVGTRLAAVTAAARDRGFNLRAYDESSVCVALDETVGVEDLEGLFAALTRGSAVHFGVEELADAVDPAIPAPFARTTPYLTHPVFNRYHSETEMLRYIRKLESRDLSLTHSMIPLGSCTMKLNATVEMFPVTWPEVSRIHPFAPREQTEGYRELFRRLESDLAEITGFAAVSLQPNAGSQGEYAGLLVHPRLPREPGRRAPRRLPHPPVRARHQPGQRRHGGDEGGGGGDRRQRQRGPGRPARQGRAARRAALRADDHLSLHARRLRGGDPGDLRHRAPPRRAGLHGRRQHERPGGAVPPRRLRRRRVPPEPAQDLLHPARRRRPGDGPHRRRGAPGALPPRAPRGPRRAGRARRRVGRRRGGAPASSPSPRSTSG